jgi:putative transposase
VHSDRGIQYVSGNYQLLLSQHGLVCSISRRGNCWDNAVVESVFRTLKAELDMSAAYKTHNEARTDIFEYIECFYNPSRLHSTIGYKSPAEYEKIHCAA